MSHPTLYKKTSTGKIQTWDISVRDNAIITTFGLSDGKKQTTEDIIKEGKNVGKANETSPTEQAQAEALAKWTKQKKKGYVEVVEDAEEGKRDALIEGGIDPMLAHPYSKHGHKIYYPCLLQYKLDGTRCIAILKNGICTLWSRTRKQITSVPHINREIERRFKQDIILDGELYNHELKNDFEQLIHFIRQEEPAEGSEVIQYHIYDLPSHEGSFDQRAAALGHLYETCFEASEYLRLVPSTLVLTYEEALEKVGDFVADGYEGGIVRNLKGIYIGKRSYDLQKIKFFEDGEFEVVGVAEGRGKLMGHAATFICLAENGNEFEAKMRGRISRLKEYWEDHSLWKGKKLTVRYFGLTNTNKVPRIGVGIALRDYE